MDVIQLVLNAIASTIRYPCSFPIILRRDIKLCKNLTRGFTIRHALYLVQVPGIGSAVAKSMGLEGANAVVNYLTDEGAEEVADWICKNPRCGEAITFKANVSKEV